MAWDGVKNEDFTKLGGNIFHSIHHISSKREGFSLGEYRMIPVQIKPFFPALDTRGEIDSPRGRINSVLLRIVFRPSFFDRDPLYINVLPG
jgi:hypothetical protein